MFELKVAAKKFLIYGTGLFGKWHCENMDGAIGFVDSNKKEDSIYNLPVYNVDEIKKR